VLLDGTGWRDVVGGHGIAQKGQRASALDVREAAGLRRDVLEERREAHVGTVVIPVIGHARGGANLFPLLRAFEDVAVATAKHLRRQVPLNDVLDLMGTGPD